MTLPWEGKYLFCNTSEDSREDRLRQRITRAFDKAGDDGVVLEQWQMDTLAERLYDKLEPHFTPSQPVTEG
jgi:hypothetical protein